MYYSNIAYGSCKVSYKLRLEGGGVLTFVYYSNVAHGSCKVSYKLRLRLDTWGNLLAEH